MMPTSFPHHFAPMWPQPKRSETMAAAKCVECCTSDKNHPETYTIRKTRARQALHCNNRKSHPHTLKQDPRPPSKAWPLPFALGHGDTAEGCEMVRTLRRKNLKNETKNLKKFEIIQKNLSHPKNPHKSLENWESVSHLSHTCPRLVPQLSQTWHKFGTRLTRHRLTR